MDTLVTIKITTPMGQMVAVATPRRLVMLEFHDRVGLEQQIQKLARLFGSAVKTEKNQVLERLESQLSEYFMGHRQQFDLPLLMMGTPFQKQVWTQLRKIPFGETRTYKEQSERLGNLRAIRAVASANGRNQLAIVIPCHRVIGTDGKLTGYAGGIERKRALLELESQA